MRTTCPSRAATSAAWKLTTRRSLPATTTSYSHASPPTLLLSRTRDFGLGCVLASHNKLVSLGVGADLHVWEGLGHATFAFSPRLLESDEVHRVIVRFFDRGLSG